MNVTSKNAYSFRDLLFLDRPPIPSRQFRQLGEWAAKRLPSTVTEWGGLGLIQSLGMPLGAFMATSPWSRAIPVAIGTSMLYPFALGSGDHLIAEIDRQKTSGCNTQAHPLYIKYLIGASDVHFIGLILLTHVYALKQLISRDIFWYSRLGYGGLAIWTGSAFFLPTLCTRNNFLLTTGTIGRLDALCGGFKDFKRNVVDDDVKALQNIVTKVEQHNAEIKNYLSEYPSASTAPLCIRAAIWTNRHILLTKFLHVATAYLRPTIGACLATGNTSYALFLFEASHIANIFLRIVVGRSDKFLTMDNHPIPLLNRWLMTYLFMKQLPLITKVALIVAIALGDTKLYKSTYQPADHATARSLIKKINITQNEVEQAKEELKTLKSSLQIEDNIKKCQELLSLLNSIEVKV